MRPWSEREAKQFLVDKICYESEREGTPLTDVERRLLIFSVAEPGTAKGIPDEVLNDIDPDWEARMTALLHNAYDRDRDDPERRQGYLDAMLRLKDSDHYILAIAEQVFSKPGRAPAVGTSILKLALSVAVGVIVLIAIAFLTVWKAD